MRLSIIIPYLNSHEIVRRHVLHIKAMDLPSDVEVIFMDDGSDPPIEVTEDQRPRNFTLHHTHDTRPWTSSLARNTGSKIAKGEYLFMLDGDYILTRKAIMRAREFEGDRLGVRRQFGVLTDSGAFTQEKNTLLEWGLSPQRYADRGAKLPPHPNHFVMRAAVFAMMGGYDEKLILGRDYPQREDTHFKRLLRSMQIEGTITVSNEIRPTVYMYPNGQFCGDVDYNPFGLFHTLTRKTEHNHWYKNPRYPKETE